MVKNLGKNTLKKALKGLPMMRWEHSSRIQRQ